MAAQPTITPVGPAAVQVHNPPVVGKPHAVLFNYGPGTVFVGGSADVTATSGLPLKANEGLHLPVNGVALYAVAGGVTLGATTSNLSTAATGGTTTNLSVASTAGFAAGQFVQIGSGTNAEVGTVSTVTSTVNLTSAVNNDHVVGQAVTVVSGYASGTIKSLAGTT